MGRSCCDHHHPKISLHFVTQGGYQGAEPEVSLTAFVLIALQEAREICKDHVNVSGPVLNPMWGEGGHLASVT